MRRWSFDHFTGWLSSDTMDAFWLTRWRICVALDEEKGIETVAFKIPAKQSKHAISDIEELLKTKYPIK